MDERNERGICNTKLGINTKLANTQQYQFDTTVRINYW